jgi:hypothetical protein
LVAASLLCALLAACNTGTTPETLSLDGLADRPVSIYNADKGTSGVESYQANVKQYYSNDRTGVNMKIVSEYRMSLKLIDGKLFTRIDYPAANMQDGIARTIVSDTSEMLVYQTESQQIEQRIPVADTAKRLMPQNAYRSLMGRLDLDVVAIQARTLAFDVIDATPGIMQVDVPSGFFPESTDGSDYRSRVAKYSVRYDTESDVEILSEMELHESDGTKVSVTTWPLYKEYGEDLLKVGQVTVSAFDVPGVLDTSDSVVDNTGLDGESFALADDADAVLLGDPSSPDKTETYVELYEDIELNALADSFFRMSF